MSARNRTQRTTIENVVSKAVSGGLLGVGASYIFDANISTMLLLTFGGAINLVCTESWLETDDKCYRERYKRQYI